MKNYTDDEIKMMAGHPDCISSIEINGFLRGFRKSEELRSEQDSEYWKEKYTRKYGCKLNLIPPNCNKWMNGIECGFCDEHIEQNSPFLQYSITPPFLPYMYPHLREEMIFNHNFDEIEKFSKECKLPKFDSTDDLLFYPPLIFEYMYPLGAAYYDFEIKNAKFKKCWVEPFDSTDGILRYKTGSYYVIFEK